jgi:hypothetical protein
MNMIFSEFFLILNYIYIYMSIKNISIAEELAESENIIKQFTNLYFCLKFQSIEKTKIYNKIASNYEEEYKNIQDHSYRPHESCCFDINEYKEAIKSDYNGKLLIWESDPIILFAVKKIDYRLPESYKLFYEYVFGLSNLTEVYIKRKNFVFVSNLLINPEVVAYPSDAYIDPFSFTCDEWIVIVKDYDSIDNGQGRIFINCNPDGNFFGKLLFYSSNDEGSCYVSSFYFDEFLLIMIDLYDKMMKINTTKINDSNSDSDIDIDIDDLVDIHSIVDYFSFSNNFDNNLFFKKRNDNIKPILNNFLLMSLCEIILEYGYYEYKPYTNNYDENICIEN